MGCVEPLGLLCIGLADERLRSNALLGTTTALQAANFFFSLSGLKYKQPPLPAREAELRRSNGRWHAWGWEPRLAMIRTFIMAPFRRWKRCYDTSIHDGAGLACIFHALEAGRKGPVGRFCVFDLALLSQYHGAPGASGSLWVGRLSDTHCFNLDDWQQKH